MKTCLMMLHAQTHIHAGSGQSDSVIDLPVQRESHTGFPCVLGSSMKGALRSHATIRQPVSTDEKNDELSLLFGKEGDGSTGSTGALMISDARLLLLPIRSLTGQFKWATSPIVLKRFQQDNQRFGSSQALTMASIQSIKQGEAIIPSNEQADKHSELYLEEYRFTVKNSDSPEDSEQLEKLVQQLAKALSYDNAEGLLRGQLVILHDEDFAYLAQQTLPVNAHIALDSETKTNKRGALWYEETLPADTVLYCGVGLVMTHTERQPVELLQSLFADSPWLQIGGNETVGMGWCHVKFLGQ